MRTDRLNKSRFPHRLAWALTVLLAASQASLAERLPLKSYTTADGLPHNAINKIVRDSRGFVWFCTEEGLSRFDGYSFTNFGVDQGLPHRSVTDLLETRSGEFWVGTNRGLALFNPRGIPTHQVVSANELPAGPLPMFTVVTPDDNDIKARVITVLFEDREGTIWCGTLKHLYRLLRKAGKFQLELMEVGLGGGTNKQIAVLDLQQDREGSLWVASFSGLFRRGRDGQTEHFGKREGLPDENVHDLMEDHQGGLWAGTRLGGFFRFAVDGKDPTHLVTQRYTKADGLPTNWIFQLFETSDQRFWVATNQGLVEFFRGHDGQAPRFHAYNQRNGLSYQEIAALNEDTGGNLWLGTNTAGAMKLTHSGFITYDAQDGLLGVYAIFEDATGAVCFRGNVLGDERTTVFEGANLNLLRANADSYYPRFGRFDGRAFNWFRPSLPFEFAWIVEQVAVQTREREWWVGSNVGLYRFPSFDSFASVSKTRPLKVYSTGDGLAGPLVFRLFVDSGDHVWVSTMASPNGLLRWDPATDAMLDLASAPKLPSLKDDLAHSFGEDRAGNIWIGFGSGVARYRDGGFTFFTTNDGLPPGAIMNIYRDHANRLWLTSSRGGLIRVDDPAAERPGFVVYSTARGLSSNSTAVIIEDLQGRIYVGTGRGLDQLDPATDRIKHFTTADGLASGEIKAAFRDRGGDLWFGTSSGLSRFVPSASPLAAMPPPILLTGLDVGGQPQNISALGEKEITLADLASNRNQLRIDFVGLGFASGDVLRYQYLMEGSGTGWSQPAEQRTINLAGLAPGRYRFLVRAVNSDGVASAAPATISFRILPPFWRRWWFLSLCALGLITLVYAVYRYRLSRLIELERVRARIATDLHDDIGAGLSRIAVLSEVARHEAGNASPAGDRLSVIAGASRELIDSMSDIVWVINPERDQLRDLTQRMRRFASDVFAARDIHLTFQAPSADQHLKVGADVRRQVFLIFKEAVNNIARHSGCTAAEVELRIEAGRFKLTVHDDGKGFDPSAPGDGNGLTNMRSRARLIGAELQFDTGHGSGTTLILSAPFKATVKEHNGRLHGKQLQGNNP